MGDPGPQIDEQADETTGLGKRHGPAQQLSRLKMGRTLGRFGSWQRTGYRPKSLFS